MSKRKRIWVLTNEFEPHIIGGLGVAATNLTRAFVNNGLKVTVLTMGKSSVPEIEKMSENYIIRLPQSTTYSEMNDLQYTASSIQKWLSHAEPPAAIHIHSPKFMTIARYFQKNDRIPVIYTCHSLVILENGRDSMNQKSLQLQQQTLQMADFVTVPSYWEQEQLIKFYPFCSNKTHVIPHGVTLRQNVSRGPKDRLLFIGRIIPVKGIDHLIQAIALLNQNGIDTTLDIVGTGPSSYVQHLRYLSYKLGISHKINWHGFVEQKKIYSLYSRYGAVVMPSHHESFGLVALESLASGMPLIATRAGGLAEFVNDDVAFTIQKPEARAIAKAILAFRKNEEGTRLRIQRGKKVAANYRWDVVAKRYAQLFRK